jgi:putative hydrolase of the HAD superfamily
MNRIQHVFFDLDRTLWDFETNSRNALTQLFAELKLHNYIPDFELFHRVYREINANYWENYAKGRVTKEQLRIGRFTDTLQSFNIISNDLATKLADGYVRISPYQTALFPGTKEILKELREQDYRLHIITNSFKEIQFIKLENSGIRDFFEAVLCSEEVGKNKPNPEIFHEAMLRTKAESSNSLMIGDDFEADVIGASRVGMRGILFDPDQLHAERQEIERVTSFYELPGKILFP